MMSAPRQKDLEAMDVFELLNNLIWDHANTSSYRHRLVKLLSIADTVDIKKLVADELVGAEPEPKSNDLVAMNVGRKNDGEQIKWIKFVMSSSWDYKDPRGKMYKAPDDVQGFLQDKLDENVTNYKDMTQSEQGLMNAISDSFISWMRKREDKP